MKTTTDIISDDAVEQVHGHANFGPTMTKRQVVDHGVLTFAFGYSSGHTMHTILAEHGLATKPSYSRRNPRLTKKGYGYLRAMFADVKLAEIDALRFKEQQQ